MLFIDHKTAIFSSGIKENVQQTATCENFETWETPGKTCGHYLCKIHHRSIHILKLIDNQTGHNIGNFLQRYEIKSRSKSNIITKIPVHNQYV